MLEVLYYDREGIYRTLAESLVIGGLPMRTDNFTGENLKNEIERVSGWIRDVDIHKHKIIELVDENGRKFLDIENNLNHTYWKEFGKYYRRGKNLGQVKPGSGHNSMYKGVTFNMVIKFPLYWLKEYQRYHFTDIVSSQSTMHKILEFDLGKMFGDEVDPRCIAVIEELRDEYNNETDKDKKRDIWRRIINSCPDGLHMVMGITINYLQATSIYYQRRNHKLKEEWGVFCDFIEELPLFKILLLGNKDDKNKFQ